MKKEHPFISRNYYEALFLTIVLAFLLKTFVISSFQVTTDSMIPLLIEGDIILVYKLKYILPVFLWEKEKNIERRKPYRGELIVFRSFQQQNTYQIKRVVGLPGDKIEIQKNHLLVNGQSMKYKRVSPKGVIESQSGSIRRIYWQSDQEINMAPVIVGAHSLFVLNDNRMQNDDSRTFGQVPIESVIGRPITIGFSIGATRLDSIRWSRFLRLIE